MSSRGRASAGSEKKRPPRRHAPGGRKGGNRRGRPGRGGRKDAPAEGRLDDQMVDYWAKSEDPKLKERAEKEKKERQELLMKKRQEKLDEDMKSYWKKQKVEEEGAENAKSE